MKFNLNTGNRLLDIVSAIFFSVVLVFIGFSIGDSFHRESNNPDAGKKDTLVFQIQSVIMDTVVISPIRVNPIETKAIQLEVEPLHVELEVSDTLIRVK
jgi:hypothetical protein